MNYIIAPYRNRKYDFDTFIERMPDILTSLFERQWCILIIEQTEGKDFNRGKLLNIGFLVCDDLSGNYILHDIDTIPNTELSKERYTLDCSEKIIGIYNSKHNTLGGISKINGRMFSTINGFPNNYFGWGVEDKALQNRVELFGIGVNKHLLNDDFGKSNFLICPDIKRIMPGDLNMRTNYEYNIFPTLSHKDKINIVMSNGLNNCDFLIRNREAIRENIEKIVVDI